MGWISPLFLVGSGHALSVHGGFIFYLCWVSQFFFVGLGHALRLHGGYYFLLLGFPQDSSYAQGMPCAYMVDLFFIAGFPTGFFVRAGHALRVLCRGSAQIIGIPTNNRDRHWHTSRLAH